MLAYTVYTDMQNERITLCVYHVLTSPFLCHAYTIFIFSALTNIPTYFIMNTAKR